LVTGVQTCALPILSSWKGLRHRPGKTNTVFLRSSKERETLSLNLWASGLSSLEALKWNIPCGFTVGVEASKRVECRRIRSKQASKDGGTLDVHASNCENI